MDSFRASIQTMSQRKTAGSEEPAAIPSSNL